MLANFVTQKNPQAHYQNTNPNLNFSATLLRSSPSNPLLSLPLRPLHRGHLWHSGTPVNSSAQSLSALVVDHNIPIVSTPITGPSWPGKLLSARMPIGLSLPILEEKIDFCLDAQHMSCHLDCVPLRGKVRHRIAFLYVPVLCRAELTIVFTLGPFLAQPRRFLSPHRRLA